MPNWNKVIVSGSRAHLIAVTASSQIAINPVAASTEAALVLGPAPAGGSGEGGQIALQPASGFTSGSFIDMYQTGTEPYWRVLRGTAASSDALIMQLNTHTKQLFLPAYTSPSSFTGTVAGILGYTSAGAIVTTTASSAGGSTFPYTGNAQINGGLGVTGSISATGPIYSTANGQMYFRGGDDAEFWDINVANTVGIYGQQDATIASIKLGSGGGIVSGKSGNIGINNTNPTQGTLDVVGNIYATSLTGSLLGTASYASNSDLLDGQHGSYYYPASNPNGYTTNTGTVTSVATSGTVSGITLTGGTITTSGTITLGGSISGLTTSNLSGTAGITNSQLANSSITIAGTSVSLGGSIAQSTILAGSGVFSGSAQIPNGSIANAQLANSSVTVGSTAISLGSSATTIAGLSSVTSTTFVGDLTGNASTATTAGTAAKIKINDDSTTNATFYPVFTDTAGSAQVLFVDSATLTWNPSTNTLTAANFVGTASWATNATTATSATSATSATTAGSVTNAVTFNNGGAGDASGTTYNGSAARTISYNTVGAPSTGGTGATGTWGIDISGNATTATTAASASSILANTVTGIVPVPFMSQKTPGVASYLGGDTILTYNTSTGTLNASAFSGTTFTGTTFNGTTFNGALSGNATTATTATTAATASTISITATDATNATFYPVFVDGQTGARISRTDNAFTYNSLTNALTLSGGSLTALTVNATASYASQSGYTMQFVLATTGSNPAASTTYRMGAPVRNQLQNVAGRTRIYVPRPGKVKYAHLYIRTNGQLASAGTSTFSLSKNTVIGETIATSATAGSSADVAVSSTAVSMSVASGDFLEINWTTPAWATLPTGVEANGIIYIENNA